MSNELNRQKIIHKLSVIFLFFIFLNDNTIYSGFFEESSSVFLTISVICLFAIIFISHKIYFGKRFVCFVSLWFLSIVLTCGIAGFTKLAIVRICYWITTLFFICVLHTVGVDVKKSIFSVCKIYCLWCLLCYFYTICDFNFLPLTNVSNTLLYKYYKVELYGYIISKPISHLHLGNLSLLRLDRPFGEPGIAQIYSNFGLIWCLFELNDYSKIYKKETIFWIIVFSIVTLLSFSLTGYIIYLLILLAYIVSKKIYAIFTTFLIVAIVVSSIMISQKLTTFSYSDRSKDYKVMIKTIINNMPFGIGIGHAQNLDYYKQYSNDSNVNGFYCGLLYPLAQHGILGCLYYYALYKSVKFFSKKKYSNYAFVCFIFFTLLTEPQSDEPIILCFIFSGLITALKGNSINLINSKRSIEE